MSQYRYETGNESIDIRPSVEDANFFIWVHEGRKEAAILIPKTDAPTVAAELLKAAGHEGVFVELPTLTVEEFPDGDLRCGLTDTVSSTTADWAWARAVELLAIAEHLKGKVPQETEAEKKLQERRDTIARDIMRNDHFPVSSYADLNWYAQKAIDRIIELEDGK